MSAIQREIHSFGNAAQEKWNEYFHTKRSYEIVYDIAGAVATCVAVMVFFANPLGALLSLGVSSLTAYGLHKIPQLSEKTGIKIALMVLVAPILGALASSLVSYPVSYFAAVVIQTATLWAASKMPMPTQP
jgi:hypothetical protein